MNRTGAEAERYFDSCRKDLWREVFRLELGWLLERLQGRRDVLSVGCGPAMLEGALAEHGFNVTGLDVSAHALRRAPAAVKVVAARAERLPFAENSFDAVISVVSLQFVDDYREAVEETRSVLRPNGALVVMLLNPASAFFAERVRDSSSYVSRIRHVNLGAIQEAISGSYAVNTGRFLRIQGNRASAVANVPDAVLYIVWGTKKTSR
jgi:ubiquinone/menaquinone biosynthesis C-methylase UbiE